MSLLTDCLCRVRFDRAPREQPVKQMPRGWRILAAGITLRAGKPTEPDSPSGVRKNNLKPG